MSRKLIEVNTRHTGLPPTSFHPVRGSCVVRLLKPQPQGTLTPSFLSNAVSSPAANRLKSQLCLCGSPITPLDAAISASQGTIVLPLSGLPASALVSSTDASQPRDQNDPANNSARSGAHTRPIASHFTRNKNQIHFLDHCSWGFRWGSSVYDLAHRPDSKLDRGRKSRLTCHRTLCGRQVHSPVSLLVALCPRRG